MSENLTMYNKLRFVPETAKKKITGGRLKGFTDINPMWRIKVLTEMFGACGTGWYTEVTKKWIEDGAKGEKAAFVDINLYYKVGGEWSAPVQGNGGSMFVSDEKGGLYTSDEAFKMSETDAFSSACKKIGIGADVYFEKDRTKYDSQDGDGGSDVNPAAACAEMLACKNMDEVTVCWQKYPSLNTDANFIAACKNVQLTIKKSESLA